MNSYIQTCCVTLLWNRRVKTSILLIQDLVDARIACVTVCTIYGLASGSEAPTNPLFVGVMSVMCDNTMD
jgi:hypothetical protein